MHHDVHLQERLLTRGDKFEDLNRLNRLNYQSFSGTVRLSGVDKQLNNARVILESAGSSDRPAPREVYYMPGPGYEDSELASRETGRIREGMRRIPASEVILCAPTVRGFSLDFKDEGDFAVDGLVDIAWDYKAFDRLALNEVYKKLILAFVEGHFARTNGGFDIIEGKGRGITMLLLGPAGVGKTLTAESIAETMGRPLYTMSAAELGESADDVERRFMDILQRCTQWGALLLLDECEVFLEKRSGTSIRQNGIVAVFLRLLEYHQCCLIMTSNRVEDLDPAFESRIDLTINYAPPDADSRLQIWRNFLRVSQRHAGSKRPEWDISEDAIQQLASLELDGRQIKSIVKIATLLADREESVLGIQHLSVVLRVTGVVPKPESS